MGHNYMASEACNEVIGGTHAYDAAPIARRHACGRAGVPADWADIAEAAAGGSEVMPRVDLFQKNKGNNKCTSSCCAEIGFAATAGWDPVTGLGTRAIRYAVKAYIGIAYGNLGWIVNIFSKKPRTRIHTTNMYCEVRSSRLSGS